jgi:hypothetical protein
MRNVVLAWMVLAGCAELPVPTDREPIEWVGHGHLAKGGVGLDGFTCGERYAAAVQGAPEAEDEIATCRAANIVYGSAILGAIAAGTTTIATGASGSHAELGAGVVLTSLVIGYAAALLAGHHLNRAVDAYNATVR